MSGLLVERNVGKRPVKLDKVEVKRHGAETRGGGTPFADLLSNTPAHRRGKGGKRVEGRPKRIESRGVL